MGVGKKWNGERVRGEGHLYPKILEDPSQPSYQSGMGGRIEMATADLNHLGVIDKAVSPSPR